MNDKQSWKESLNTHRSWVATRATRRVNRWFAGFRAWKQSLSKTDYLGRNYLGDMCTSVSIS